MVDILGLSFSGLYASYSIGGLFIIGIIIWAIRHFRSSGRVGEERQEERETDILRLDEKRAARAQKDENRQCKILDGFFSDIMLALLRDERKDLHNKVTGSRQRISKMLHQLRDGRMNVQRTIAAFKILHADINEFISHLPRDNELIIALINEIQRHQDTYYEDLIQEWRMDEDKKKQIRLLWRQTIDQETGSGELAA